VSQPSTGSPARTASIGLKYPSAVVTGVPAAMQAMSYPTPEGLMWSA
jgi:hypothetical protein